MIKRFLDVVLASILLVATLPVCVITVCYIRLVSGGPVIFRQERVGKYGHQFIMFKFRNMRVGSPLLPRVTRRDDPRLIPGAVWLRSTYIDELPQLWNVIKGEMSLVGPRPVPTIMARQYERSIPGYAQRYTVLPGMTGLEQLWGRLKQIRKGPSACARIDRYYVRKQNICMDVHVMILTIALILRRHGV